MQWDIRVIYEGWWPVGWYFKILGDRVLAVKESPFNPLCRETLEEVSLEDITVELWNNQYAELWDLQKLISFLRSCTEPEVKVTAAEWLENENSVSEVLREIGAWFTPYAIYD